MKIHTPLYSGHGVNPAYQLRYSWCGWFTQPYVPLRGWEIVFLETAPGWERDGIRVLETAWREQSIQVLFSATPTISPAQIASRAKGRLQHTLRSSGHPCKFSRKVSIRSVGDNTSTQVEHYIRSQVGKEEFVDAGFAKFIEQFTVIDSQLDLSLPTKTRSGRYWYNLHVVLVVRERGRLVDCASLSNVRDTVFAVAHKKSHPIGALSLMPDHLHLALRGNIENSPQEIALAFQNNTAWRLGQKAIWQDNYYAGTFSEYDMKSIRRRSQWRATSNV